MVKIFDSVCLRVKVGTGRVMAAVMMISIAVAASGQNRISVKNFTYDENESTALTIAPKGVKDNNRQKCALIVVHNVSVGGYTFNTGGWNKAENRSINGKSVVNLWVSPSTKWIEIGNSDMSIKPSERFYFNQQLESDKTYHLWLGDIIMTSKTARQYVRVQIDAPEASLFVDETGDGQFVAWPLINGEASKSMPLGEYSYKITAPDYYDDFGKFSVTDPNQQVNVNLHLRPHFGWLTIPATGNLNGAQIIVDGKIIGTSSLNRYKLGSGNYKLQVQKPKYKVFIKDITITDNTVSTEPINLEPNFSRMTLECTDAQADIYLLDNNGLGTKMATGTWCADLEPGSYMIETRRQSHRNGSLQISIAPGSAQQYFKLPSPEPIYGSIDINSEPKGARILLDGQEVGFTPFYLNNILIGKHDVRILKEGYNDYNVSVDVSENADSKVSARLDDMVYITITSNPTGAALYVNTQYVGPTPYMQGFRKGEKLSLLFKQRNYSDLKTSLVADKTSTRSYGLEKLCTCLIDGAYGAHVKIDGKEVWAIPYTLTGERGAKHKVEVYWYKNRSKKQKRTIILGKDTRYFADLKYHRNRGRQAANIIMTVLLPSVGWLSWLFNPVSD